MQCPHCAHPDYILFGKKSRGSTLPLPSLSTNLSDTVQRQGSPALKEQAQKLYLEGLGLRAIGRILRVHHKTLSRWLVQAAGQLPVNQPKTKACSLIEVDELCSFVAKKSKCWIWVALDSTFGKVLGFVCGSRSIKTARELFKQWKGLPTMGYGTDFLKTYEHLIPTALHPQGKTFTTQIESLNCRFRHCLAQLHRRTLC